MIISGTFADGRTLHLRPLELGDYLLWAECKADWPRDKKGYYTLSRAISDTDRNVRDNAAVVVPLGPDSKWVQTLVAYTDEFPQGIGVHRARAMGTAVHVLQQAIHPSHRGAGWFSLMNQLLSVYAFEYIGADVVTFEIVESTASAKTYVANRSMYGSLGQRQGETGKTLDAGRQRVADYRQWVKENPERVPSVLVTVSDVRAPSAPEESLGAAAPAAP